MMKAWYSMVLLATTSLSVYGQNSVVVANAGDVCVVISTLVLALPIESATLVAVAPATQQAPASATNTPPAVVAVAPATQQNSPGVATAPAAAGPVSPAVSQAPTGPRVVTMAGASVPTQIVSASLQTTSTPVSNRLPVQSSAAIGRLRVPMAFTLLLFLQNQVDAYIKTVGTLVYSCSAAGGVASPQTTTTASAFAATRPATTTKPLSTKPAGQSGGCIFDGDCPGRLTYCSGGTCRLGECAGNSDCGANSRCRSHSCEACRRGALGIVIC